MIPIYWRAGRKSEFCFEVGNETRNPRRRGAVALDHPVLRRSSADTRLRGDARGRDGGVCEELAAGIARLSLQTLFDGLERTSIFQAQMIAKIDHPSLT